MLIVDIDHHMSDEALLLLSCHRCLLWKRVQSLIQHAPRYIGAVHLAPAACLDGHAYYSKLFNVRINVRVSIEWPAIVLMGLTAVRALRHHPDPGIAAPL